MRRLAEQYLSETSICPAYAAQLRHRVRSFCDFCGEDVLPANATPERVNPWLVHLVDRGLSPVTVAGYRRNILTLLAYGAVLGLCAMPCARRYRRPRYKLPPPTAWTVQVGRLLYTCKSFHTHWLAYCRVAYETGLRRGDIWRIDQVSTEVFQVVEHKTGTVRPCIVRAATVEAVLAAGGLRPPWEPSHWSWHARQLVKSAELCGTLKLLRRSHGSLVGTLYHSAGHTLRRHYLDSRIVVPSMPPDPA